MTTEHTLRLICLLSAGQQGFLLPTMGRPSVPGPGLLPGTWPRGLAEGAAQEPGYHLPVTLRVTCSCGASLTPAFPTTGLPDLGLPDDVPRLMHCPSGCSAWSVMTFSSSWNDGSLGRTLGSASGRTRSRTSQPQPGKSRSCE